MIWKRLFDLFVSGSLLLLTSPLLALLTGAVKVSSRGPVLHRATRVGRCGDEFVLYKFRTMMPGNDGPGVTGSGDWRITTLGRFLRATKLDELPQLWNVLKGDMSLVGPRPEDPRYVAHYSEEQRRVLTVRPGMTSLASIAYRHEEALLASAPGEIESFYVERVLPEKVALDLEYLNTRTFALDLRILGMTAMAVLRRSTRELSKNA